MLKCPKMPQEEWAWDFSTPLRNPLWRIGKENVPLKWSPHLHKINKPLLLEKPLHQHRLLLRIINLLGKMRVLGRTIRPLQGADCLPLALQLQPEDFKKNKMVKKTPG